jgi:hypothetical protein
MVELGGESKEVVLNLENIGRDEGSPKLSDIPLQETKTNGTKPIIDRLKSRGIKTDEEWTESIAGYLLDKMEYLKKQVKIYEESCYYYRWRNLALNTVGLLLGVALSPSSVMAEQDRARYAVAFLILVSTILLAGNSLFLKYGEKYIQFYHMSKRYLELHNSVEQFLVLDPKSRGPCKDYFSEFRSSLKELESKVEDLLPPNSIVAKYN